MSSNLRERPLPKWIERDPNEPGISKHMRHNILYYRQLHKATPPWANFKGIKAWYKLARKLGKEVDHIVPINHPYVCGLHCEANFQLLTPEQNLSKSNFQWPDSPFETFQLFNDPNEPEQLELNI